MLVVFRKVSFSVIVPLVTPTILQISEMGFFILHKLSAITIATPHMLFGLHEDRSQT